MKKVLTLVLAVVLLLTAAAGCGSNGANTAVQSKESSPGTAASGSTVSSGEKGKNIGFILAGSDIYYQKGYEVFEALAGEEGWKVTKTTSDYDPKKETNNVQDMVAKKVDAIVLCTVNSSNGSKAGEIANKAGIPIFYITSIPDPKGPGKPDGCVSGPWYEGGYEIGVLVGKNYPATAKIVTVEGGYGQAIAELHRMGFLDALAEAWGKTPKQVFDDNIVYNQTGGFMTDKAQTVMQDAISKTGGNFDLVYVHNEAMMDGVLKAIKSTGKTYPVYAINGKETTIQQIKEGTVEATVSIPPSSEGEMVFQQVKAKFKGETYPVYLKNIYVPVVKNNVETASILPWLDSKNYVEMSKAGKTGIDIMKLKDSGPTDPDWSEMLDLNGAKSK
ncbi:sugar ABC transporter substrate-binding protein [Ruminiclostridium cellobioparum]|uniref:ABC-type sugar transport system, periplasmic component n=1 Tax=Ruminiclostridium cellobioparum subsp. termitidis CT1112 TaxID=1195236 RepID=S0FTB7_RUMCE|nr:sugar ABC transporter substrate-binding protein [Ruminiclostridium cellobioparum]EMS73576.1 ABC-type sugar transport system, periplasmic component [Ruminiclostridium cellobioparum subsp. termitidis CT1112]